MNNDIQIQPLEILRLDSSSRHTVSVSRQLTDHLITRLLEKYPLAKVTTRDLTANIPLPSEAFVDGSLYAVQNPTQNMKNAVARSNELVAELHSANVIVLGLPIYNWSIPATFKAYVDQISRLGVTFGYSDGVSKGLLKAKIVYILFTSGGTAIGSENDFATPYTTFLWRKLGIENVQFIDASGLLFNPQERTQNAMNQIDQLEFPALN